MKSDTIFLINAEGGLEKIPNTQYESEDLLQKLVERHPEILVGDHIDPDNPPRWLLIEREVGIPDREGGSDRWAIDHLLLDQNGRPTFVEVKRSSDSRIRREVVGQMLDYAANAKVYWPKDRIRALAAESSGGVDELETRLVEFLNATEGTSAVEDYWNSVERHLRNGEVRLLFVADSIPTELRSIIEFLNDHMPLVEVLGIEIRQYEGQDVRALVPRVIGQTEYARQQKSSSTQAMPKTTLEKFLSGCSGKSGEFFSRLLTAAQKHGYKLTWGTKGFSLRLPADNGTLLSLFYGYPAAEDGPPVPLFQAYLGYVEDPRQSQDLRQSLLSLAPFEEKGKYTLQVALRGDEPDQIMPNLDSLLSAPKSRLLGVK